MDFGVPDEVSGSIETPGPLIEHGLHDWVALPSIILLPASYPGDQGLL